MEIRVAYFGEVPGSYTYQAAKVYFRAHPEIVAGHEQELVPCTFISEVFRKTKEGECQYGVVPVENFKGSHVVETFDELSKIAFKNGTATVPTIHIFAELELPISHRVVGIQTTTLNQIKNIHSYHQALAQCESFIRARGLKPIQSGDTGVSAKKIAEMNSKTDAAISSDLAAKLYGLKVLQRKVTSGPNKTRFYVLSKNESTETPDTTAILVGVRHTAGALNAATSYLSKYNINMLDLLKRPAPRRTKWHEVDFHIECQAGLHEERMQKALAMLRGHVDYVKVVGSYKKSVMAR
jgi:prephenate dehydratase